MHKDFVNTIQEEIQSTVSRKYLHSAVYYIQENSNIVTGKFGGAPIDVDSNFQIASMTKSFTGLVLSKLIKNKTISLGSKVGEFLNINPEVNRITLVELLTHHSGLPRDFKKTILDRNNLYAYITNSEALSQLSKISFDSEKTMSYSNVNAVLIGIILESIFNLSIVEIINNEIIKPILMNKTNFKKEGLVQGYSSMGLKANSFDFNEAFNAAGGISSNITDLIKYADYLKNNDEMFTSLKKLKEFNLGYFSELLDEDNILLSCGVLKASSSMLAIDRRRNRICIVLSNTGVDITKFVYPFINLETDMEEKNIIKNISRKILF